jgi:hypothetical protein
MHVSSHYFQLSYRLFYSKSCEGFWVQKNSFQYRSFCMNMVNQQPDGQLHKTAQYTQTT